MKTIINKRGSYILEATISLPIFMIAVIVMSSVILMFSCIEDANFISATELKKGTVESASHIPDRIKERVMMHSQVKNLEMEEFEIAADRWGNDRLILYRSKMIMSSENPLNIAADASYELSLVTRKYVGKERSTDNMTEAEMMNEASVPVYIFPKRGEKYHNESCTFLKAATKSAALSEAIKKKYSSCPVCHSRKAMFGSLIYYFPADGESYHLPGCACLERNYIELEKGVAEKRGYTACSKCGG